MPRHATPTSFQKGHIPITKGKKLWGKDGMSGKEHPLKGKHSGIHPKTEFKKGHPAWFKKEDYQPEMHPAFKGGVFSLRKILIRDRRHCEGCGIDNQHVLDIHHIDRDGTNNSLENLKLLCANCHRMEHVGAGEEQGEGD
jgi:hypothetical protein